MFDLKTGDTVLHKGVKRTVIQTRVVCGRKLLHLDNGGPMVRAESVIPPSRLNWGRLYSATAVPQFDPKIGDVVFFNGKKRRIINIRHQGATRFFSFDDTVKCALFNKIKPIVRLTDRERAKMLVSYVGYKFSQCVKGPSENWIAVHSFKNGLIVTREEYDAALATLARRGN